MATKYHWVITKDLITDPEHDIDHAGTHGPAATTLTPEEIQHHPKGRAFKMRDADGTDYYEGVYVGPDDETLFTPLDDFGTPNAGCTEIAYRNALGAWEWI